MPTTSEEIRAAVKDRFAQVANRRRAEKKPPVAPASAKVLGYDPNEIDTLPISVMASFVGVGNPPVHPAVFRVTMFEQRSTMAVAFQKTIPILSL